MQTIRLPKLTKVDLNKVKKPKILLLSDDLRMHSGIATMSREFVIGTSDTFDWVQLGAALKHPEHGKVFDVSSDVNANKGITDSSVKIYAHSGYGNPEVLREIIKVEKPDAILHFTDPRFWGWLYAMEHEIRSKMKLPIMYYNIWDAPPAPMWNKPFYQSCDLIMNISKQTNNLVKIVLGQGAYRDIRDGDGDGDTMVCHVPHGINKKQFNKITVFFWNNRNIRRKMMGDLILAYKKFCDSLPPEKAKRVALFMHTQMRDNNGTDIPEVVRVVCPEYKVIFNEEKLPTRVLNMFYNMADITLNIASNEGFSDVADQMRAWYDTPREERDRVGLEGQAWLLSEESGMSANEMSNRMRDAITECLNNWVPRERFELITVTEPETIGNVGIVW